MKTQALLLGLQAFVARTLADTDPVPRVHIYDLPRSGQTDFPFVLLRLVKGQTEEEHCEDAVGLFLGVHAPENPETAGLVCAELGDTLRRALWKQRIIEDCFELQMPFDIVQPDPDRQQHEYHMLTLVTRWNYVTPSRVIGGDYRGEQFVFSPIPKE